MEAERAAIRKLSDVEWLKAAQAKDLESALSYYADDASLLPPNAPIATGKEAIRTLWSELLANPSFVINWQTTKVEVSGGGDLGYTSGTMELTLHDPEGKPVTERSKWVDVWRKQPNGNWKVMAGVWNSDHPPTD
ncbi:MAG: YybH family protein [Terriglobia bacterium]